MPQGQVTLRMLQRPWAAKPKKVELRSPEGGWSWGDAAVQALLLATLLGTASGFAAVPSQ